MTVKVKYAQVIIERDPMTKIPKEVAPWEVPIYRAQYGDEKIEIVGEREVELDDLPEPLEEYARLRQQFGIDADTKQSFADIVYGRGQHGVDNLKAALAKGKSVSRTAKIENAIEGAQKVVDGKGGVDEETELRRAEAYRDPAGDEFTDARPNLDSGQGLVAGDAAKFGTGGPDPDFETEELARKQADKSTSKK